MSLATASPAPLRSRPAEAHARPLGPVRVWLFVLAGLVALMVLVGGATRLTDSGLSITEWRPITGIVPPLSQAVWEEEFAKYRRIPEYRVVNSWMDLSDFKTIYWWEWGHRFLGRLIGFAFAAPFLAFVALGRIDRRLMVRLLAILALGASQAVAGWWMVASGLSGRVDVSQYRLTIHLTLACVIFAAILWTAFSLRAEPRSRAGRAERFGAAFVLALVFLQIALGGLVAGLDAGLAYNTWPLMDGAVWPSGLLVQEPWWRNFFENAATVQFDHRLVGYIVALAAFAHAAHLVRAGSADARRRASWLAAAVLFQVALGVATLLAFVPLPLALLHQAGALLVLGVATHNAQTALR